MNKTWTPDIYVEMWNMISDLMIELELPILKARSRDEYAMEQEMSPWSIGMLSDKEKFQKHKTANIYTNFHAVYRSVCTTSKVQE